MKKKTEWLLGKFNIQIGGTIRNLLEIIPIFETVDSQIIDFQNLAYVKFFSLIDFFQEWLSKFDAEELTPADTEELVSRFEEVSASIELFGQKIANEPWLDQDIFDDQQAAVKENIEKFVVIIKEAGADNDVSSSDTIRVCAKEYFVVLFYSRCKTLIDQLHISMISLRVSQLSQFNLVQPFFGVCQMSLSLMPIDFRFNSKSIFDTCQPLFFTSSQLKKAEPTSLAKSLVQGYESSVRIVANANGATDYPDEKLSVSEDLYVQVEKDKVTLHNTLTRAMNMRK